MAVTDLTRGFWRKLYAGFLTGRRINSVSIGAECLFWRLHAIADDYGNFPSDPDTFLVRVFPRRKVAKAKCSEWLAELVTAKLVQAYRVGEDSYGCIVDFEGLQMAEAKNGKRVQKHPRNPESSKIFQDRPENPAPPIPRPVPDPDQTQITPTPTPSDPECVQAEQSPEPGEGPPSTAIPFPLIREVFRHYPRKIGEEAAFPEIERAVYRIAAARGYGENVHGAAQWLVSRVRAYAASDACQRGESKYIPHPAKWFLEGRYNDDEAAWKASEPNAAPVRKRDYGKLAGGAA